MQRTYNSAQSGFQTSSQASTHSGACTMSLAGKTVLITGGGTGIGAGCALALAAEGCRVAISGRREEPLQAVAAKHTGDPPIIYRTCDVGDRDDAYALV